MSGETETVFADLQPGDAFRITENGATFRKRGDGSAMLERPTDDLERRWVGAVYHFGQQKPVTRA